MFALKKNASFLKLKVNEADTLVVTPTRTTLKTSLSVRGGGCPSLESLVALAFFLASFYFTFWLSQYSQFTFWSAQYLQPESVEQTKDRLQRIQEHIVRLEEVTETDSESESDY
jgi:hypothetical protein